jgi:hypothetical protein
MQGAWGSVLASDTDEMDWVIAVGAGFEYRFSSRFALGGNLESVGFHLRADRVDLSRVVLQPTLFSSGSAMPRVFAGVRMGFAWRSARGDGYWVPVTPGQGGLTLGLILGYRSFVSRRIGVEGGLVGDVMRVATSTAVTSLLIRVGVVLSLGSD